MTEPRYKEAYKVEPTEAERKAMLPEAFQEATTAVVQKLQAEVVKLQTKLAEYDQSFELYYSALRRGHALWQSKHPMGHPMVLPDSGMLVEWLLELVTQAEEAVNGLGEGSQGARSADATTAGHPRRPGGADASAGA